MHLYNKISKNYKNARILTTTNEKSKKLKYVVLTRKIFCVVPWKYLFLLKIAKKKLCYNVKKIKTSLTML